VDAWSSSARIPPCGTAPGAAPAVVLALRLAVLGYTLGASLLVAAVLLATASYRIASVLW
jgi:hypothetical protein